MTYHLVLNHYFKHKENVFCLNSITQMKMQNLILSHIYLKFWLEIKKASSYVIINNILFNIRKIGIFLHLFLIYKIIKEYKGHSN